MHYILWKEVGVQFLKSPPVKKYLFVVFVIEMIKRYFLFGPVVQCTEQMPSKHSMTVGFCPGLQIASIA